MQLRVAGWGKVIFMFAFALCDSGSGCHVCTLQFWGFRATGEGTTHNPKPRVFVPTGATPNRGLAYRISGLGLWVMLSCVVHVQRGVENYSIRSFTFARLQPVGVVLLDSRTSLELMAGLAQPVPYT